MVTVACIKASRTSTTVAAIESHARRNVNAKLAVARSTLFEKRRQTPQITPSLVIVGRHDPRPSGYVAALAPVGDLGKIRVLSIGQLLPLLHALLALAP